LPLPRRATLLDARARPIEELLRTISIPACLRVVRLSMLDVSAAEPDDQLRRFVAFVGDVQFRRVAELARSVQVIEARLEGAEHGREHADTGTVGARAQ